MTDILQKLQQATAALAAAEEPENAERQLLEELCQLCNADLAVLLQPENPQCWRSTLLLEAGVFSTTGRSLEISWETGRHRGQLRNVVEQVLQQPRSLCCHDPVRAGEFDFSHLRLIEIEHDRQVCSSLLLPLSIHNGRPRQIVELIRLENDHGGEGFSIDEQMLGSILAQQASSALERMHSRQEQGELFESLIQLIASAIDEKSPFAGDHCRRVPVLTMMLARAVSASKKQVFKAVHFSDAELYELEVSAWLHDIGKLLTPINISDKATKLERTFDRFDLVRTRFEILRRDLEIALLRGGEDVREVEIPDTSDDLQQMLDDLRFLGDCNRGRNSLSDLETGRVYEIAERYRWVDRQGEERPVLTEDEAANLMVVRGTLTDDEREMINHHVVSTINMLDMLPFPEELARVPEIAGSHHETCNGHGFPTGLSGEHMLVQTRVLAFADRFESISAGGRPYKKRNSLNQSLRILREMVDEGLVDSDLYRLFIGEKLYESYGNEFLSRDQIDQVDQKVLLEGL
jgi:HD-GYP domain-containing protein (c-di-GMP phosphodiesterase class II)